VSNTVLHGTHVSVNTLMYDVIHNVTCCQSRHNDVTSLFRNHHLEVVSTFEPTFYFLDLGGENNVRFADVEQNPRPRPEVGAMETNDSQLVAMETE